ncbi:MAG TPA: RNB domain-containing ribonuclease [Methylomirabilota bacterium]|nr:RNB domain-containing ribonuclease [Methylomirabilota bacterium]
MKKRRAVEELPGQRYVLSGAKPAASSHPARTPANPDRADAAHQARHAVAGRLVLHADGYGFVVPDPPIPGLDGDIFIPRSAVEDAMHGDRVLVQITRRTGSPGALRAEGRILRVTDRAHPTLVGLFRYAPRGNVVLPYDARIHHEIAIPPGEELTPALREKYAPAGLGKGRASVPRLAELDGAVVNAEILRYPRGAAGATGRVIEIVGRPGEIGVDTEIVIRKHHLPHVFPREVAVEAKHRAHPVSAAEREGREDFRALPIVTIDGETARDFDDAVYVERRPGGWALQVHIADVSHYVRGGSPLDGEARLRGTSVYFPDRAVPMLPEELSNGICSLNPLEDRLVLSALMEFDSGGRILGARFARGVIRSAARMTYTGVNKVLEGNPETSARYVELAPHFRNMRELALLLNARRSGAGSIDFDLPEPVLEFDEQQQIVAISRSERNIAHRLIEEFMLAANRAVASHLQARGILSLHRVHEKPDVKKVLEFEELASAFGYSLGVEGLVQRSVQVRHGRVPAPARHGRPDSYGHGRERPMRVALPGAAPGAQFPITPRHYQRLVEKLAGKPEERILSYLMLRSLKQARYAAEPLGHFALGFDEYTHFTSPIRRYPDLIVHRILKWALDHPGARGAAPAPHAPAPGAEAVLYSRSSLDELSAETSEAERRAVGAERELMDWKRAQFMEEHLGEHYEGLIISVQKYGCFVELFEEYVEGLLPIAALEEAAGTRCVFRERDHAIVAAGPARGQVHSRRAGKSAPRAWRLGDRVKVRAERIDPTRRRVEFALAE